MSVKVPIVAWGNTLPKNQEKKQEVVQPMVNNLSDPSFFGKDNEISMLEVDMKMTSLLPISDKIVASYKDDYNILYINKMILHKLEEKKNGYRQILESKIKLVESKLSIPHNMVEHKIYVAEKEDILKELKSITTGNEIQDYLNLTKSIIEEYSKISSNVKVISFTIIDTKEKPVDDNSELRHRLIHDYLNIAKKYMDLNIIREVIQDTRCPECSTELKDLVPDENGIQRCPNGCYEKFNLMQMSNYKDSLRINLSNRNSYDNRDNFLKAIMRQQGKQPNRLPKDMMTELDKYFKDFNLPLSEQVRKMTPEEKSANGINFNLLFRAMGDRGYTAYYDDFQLIGNLYWGLPLMNFTHLEDLLMQDYDGTQKYYDNNPVPGRTSCLNGQYRLYQHLRTRGFHCSIEQFRMINSESRQIHDIIWKPMIESIGLPYYPTV